MSKNNARYCLNKPKSEEIKKKISISLKKRYKNGYIHPMKNNHHKESSKRKISIAHKGMIVSMETRRKLSEANKGEKSYCYKGGVTSKNRIVRNGIEFRLWREAVFARDNYTCQKYCLRSGNGKKVYIHGNKSSFSCKRSKRGNSV